MRFDERFLEEIKSRLRLSDVIGRTVKLRRQGREFVGLSPFNKEKSASFFVNDDKGFYHDFSSGKHGDLISFLQETERLSFPEAVERLAAEAGLVLPSPDPRAAEAEQRRAGLQDWLDEATAWFEAQLRRPVGGAARLYLDKRGLPEAERSRFRLGYALANRTALKDLLIAKGGEARRTRRCGFTDPAGGRCRVALRPLSRPDHLPHRRRARLAGVVRRPGARSRGARQVSERTRDGALLQEPHPLRPA